MNSKYPIGTLLYSPTNKLGILLGFIHGQYLCNTVYWFELDYHNSASDESIQICHDRYLELVRGYER